MTDVVFEAPPRSGESIEAFADAIRTMFHLQKDPVFPVLGFLEFGLGQVVDGMFYDVMSKEELGAREGAVDPLRRALYVREDVYDAAEKGNGRARFTIAHEIGHAVMHVGTLNRAGFARTIPAYRDPEWQANRFAAALLMPRLLVSQYSTVAEVVDAFHVSSAAARLRLQNNGLRRNWKE